MAHSRSEEQQRQHHHSTPIPYSAVPSNPASNSPYCPPFPLDDPTTTRDLLDAAQFMSQDSDLRVFHRFDSLRLFVLLRLQHRLATLARELEGLRRLAEKRGRNGHVEGGLGAGAEDEDVDGRLEALAGRIGPVLKEYDDAFAAQARLECLPASSGPFIERFIRYCAAKFAFLPSDLGASQDFKAEWLVCTMMREKSWFHRWIDSHEVLKRLFEIKTKQKGSQVFRYSESRIRLVERIFMHVSFCIMLLCPVIALSIIETNPGKLAVVVVFLLAVAILTSGIISGENNAGLAVLAGYGAILIFFLGVNVDVSRS